MSDPTPVRPPQPEGPEPGPLLGLEAGRALEQHDRRQPARGGEPECPRCGARMVRGVERHRAPRSDGSPFLVRLACGAATCGAWTTYHW